MEMDGFASDTQLETANFGITVDFYLLETVIVSFVNCQTYSFVKTARFDLRHLPCSYPERACFKAWPVYQLPFTLIEVSCGFTHLRQTNAYIGQY
jgi:hypothetical protein